MTLRESIKQSQTPNTMKSSGILKLFCWSSCTAPVHIPDTAVFSRCCLLFASAGNVVILSSVISYSLNIGWSSDSRSPRQKCHKESPCARFTVTCGTSQGLALEPGLAAGLEQCIVCFLFSPVSLGLFWIYVCSFTWKMNTRFMMAGGKQVAFVVGNSKLHVQYRERPNIDTLNTLSKTLWFIFWFKNSLHLFSAYMCECIQMRRSEDNLRKSVLSFIPADKKANSAHRFGCKCPYPLSHIASPF